MSVTFTVHGTPAPAGSKRGFYNPKAKRVIITDDSTRSRPWKALVSDAAAQAMLAPDEQSRTLVCRPLLGGPLRLTVDFYLPRPKGHYGTRGNVRPSAPAYPAVKPDATKLLRAVEDALAGIVYRDDAQVVEQHVAKHYGEPARAVITVQPMLALERQAA